MTAFIPGTTDKAGAYDTAFDLKSFDGLVAEIRDDERFFTVRNAEGQPVGTITRPRVLGKDRDWTVATTDGVVRYRGVGPRTVFNRLAQFLRG